MTAVHGRFTRSQTLIQNGEFLCLWNGSPRDQACPLLQFSVVLTQRAAPWASGFELNWQLPFHRVITVRFWLFTEFHNLPSDSGSDVLFRFLTWKQDFRGVFRSFFCWEGCTVFQLSSFGSLGVLRGQTIFSTLHSAAVLFSPLLPHPSPLSSWSVEYVLRREEQPYLVCSGIARIPDYQSFSDIFFVQEYYRI